MRVQFLLLALSIVILEGCSSITKPITAGEGASGYTYVPIDPFSVQSIEGESCQIARLSAYQLNDGSFKPLPDAYEFKDLLSSLPDNTVRQLIEIQESSGKVSFNIGSVNGGVFSSKVTVDYINADTVNYPMAIKRMAKLRSRPSEPPVAIGLNEVIDNLSPFINGTDSYEIKTYSQWGWKSGDPDNFGFTPVNIPVYVGVGLRVIANVTDVSGKANLNGIGVIGAEAESKNLKGSLTVQTLGINGKSISAALPIQSELNRTTAFNALIAVGQIKALLYSDETLVSPRIVGVYLPILANRALVNAVISQLSYKPLEWERQCVKKIKTENTLNPSKPDEKAPVVKPSENKGT